MPMLFECLTMQNIYFVFFMNLLHRLILGFTLGSVVSVVCVARLLGHLAAKRVRYALPVLPSALVTLQRSVCDGHAPRSAAPFGVSFPVLKIWENVETRASAQTPTFSDPNFSALQARRPDWGAWPSHTLHCEYRVGG
jgi:hypothetical protein